jgi:hypothetical protein
MACRLKRRPTASACTPHGPLPGSCRHASEPAPAPWPSTSADATTMPVRPWSTNSALPPTRVATTGKPGRHRFKNGIGDTLGQGWQHETIQTAHDFCHVAPLAGQPGQFSHAGRSQNASGTARATGHHPPAPGAHLPHQRLQLQRAHKGIGEQGLRLHALHATHGADHPLARPTGRAAQEVFWRNGWMEALRVDAVVDLADARRADAHLADQVVCKSRDKAT